MGISLKTAIGEELDVFGKKQRNPRRLGEPDDQYRDRLINNHGDDGGLEFGEFQQVGNISLKTGGMSLRDYFAAKAMRAIVGAGGNYDFDGEMPIAVISEHAYALADAMLLERAK